MQQIDISVCIQPVGDSGGDTPFRLLTTFAATFPRRVKANPLSQSLTALPAPPKGELFGIYR